MAATPGTRTGLPPLLLLLCTGSAAAMAALKPLATGIGAMGLARSSLPLRSRLVHDVFMGGVGFGAAAKDTFKYTGSMRPGKQSPTRKVPKTIPKPDYAKDGRPKATGPSLPWQIEVKNEKDIEGMRVAGRVAREKDICYVCNFSGCACHPDQVLDLAHRAVAVGVTTDAIDQLVHDETIKRGGYPSPLNYHGESLHSVLRSKACRDMLEPAASSPLSTPAASSSPLAPSGERFTLSAALANGLTGRATSHLLSWIGLCWPNEACSTCHTL
eukprot:2907890-Pleurochrysis_carterae.AAC.2